MNNLVNQRLETQHQALASSAHDLRPCGRTCTDWKGTEDRSGHAFAQSQPDSSGLHASTTWRCGLPL